MSEHEPGTELTVTSASEGHVPVMSVSGELDMSNADALRSAVEASDAVRAGRLVLDLRDLCFIDSAGLAVLLEAADRVDSVVLRSPTRAVRRVIEVTGLTHVLSIEP